MTNSDCVFCSRQAITKNEQKLPTCNIHKKETLPDMKCVCGEYLMIKESKYGPFFICMNCGPVSIRKALSINPIKPKVQEKPREITVRSDEVDFL
ncbi:MAG: hypothetical protein KKF89_03820 [Nanoarchaeota archaeon]|nr:hypothetical protein [Nanoarchaeota archaeon]MBU1854824.1 hypothetical protein [Nanoarchaeota archaeon]